MKAWADCTKYGFLRFLIIKTGVVEEVQPGSAVILCMSKLEVERRSASNERVVAPFVLSTL